MQSEVTVVPGVRERAVRFESGGETVVGVLSLPESGNMKGEGRPRRGVVVLHGWGTYRAGPHDILVKLCRRLACGGRPALRFDHRARGESTGDAAEIGLDEMIDDACRAAEFLREQAGIQGIQGIQGIEGVDAVGLCSGSNVALGAAAHEGAFDNVVALSVLPFQSHKSAMQSLRRTRGKLVDVLLKALRPSTWWRLLTGRVRVFRVIRNLFGGEGGKVKTAEGTTRNLKDSRRDLMGALGRFEGRLLFVWGGADAEGMGAKSHFEEFARAKKLRADFRVIDGANHNFYSLAWEREVFELVEGFMTGGGRP